MRRTILQVAIVLLALIALASDSPKDYDDKPVVVVEFLIRKGMSKGEVERLLKERAEWCLYLGLFGTESAYYRRANLWVNYFCDEVKGFNRGDGTQGKPVALE